MKRIIGMAIGLGYFGIVFYTLGISRQGWADGNPDIGFWWAVVTGFLAIAGVAALLQGRIPDVAGRAVGIVLSGGNVNIHQMKNYADTWRLS